MQCFHCGTSRSADSSYCPTCGEFTGSLHGNEVAAGRIRIQRIRTETIRGWSRDRALDRLDEFRRDAERCARTGMCCRAALHWWGGAEFAIALGDVQTALLFIDHALRENERGITCAYPADEAFLGRSEINTDVVRATRAALQLAY